MINAHRHDNVCSDVVNSVYNSPPSFKSARISQAYMPESDQTTSIYNTPREYPRYKCQRSEASPCASHRQTINVDSDSEVRKRAMEYAVTDIHKHVTNTGRHTSYIDTIRHN